MKEIKHAIIDRLEQKNLNKLSIWAFLIQHCKKKSKNPKDFSWYLRRQTLFLKLPNEDDSMNWFMFRFQLMDELNKALSDAWYSYILKEIKIWTQ